jgi:taurine transport system ATP-binding protein
MNKIIDIKNLYIDYDNDDSTLGAINDVSLDIYENDFVCILGPSGCGKSTLLKSIAGFIKPTKGSIQMHGEEIIAPDKARGVVFQEPNLFPWFTVKQNVVIGPKMAKKDIQELEEISNKYLKQVELEEYQDTKVFELSGGQKQRVAIARTLANQPEVILMDEPFGALDSFTRQKMQKMIRHLWKQNQSTICFVTHDIEEALLLGTKIYVLRRGLKSIIKSYTIDFTKMLLKDPKIKVLEDETFINLKEEILALLEE